MNKSQLKKDIFLYSALIIISLLFYFVLVPQQIALRGSWSGDVVFTSRTFPYLIFIILGIVSFIGFVQTLTRLRNAVKEQGEQTEQSYLVRLKGLVAPIYFMLLIIVYGYLFGKFGYIISNAIILPIFLFSLKSRNWRHYLVLYAFAALVYVVFKFVLKIPL